jgi:hypothetical protein
LYCHNSPKFASIPLLWFSKLIGTNSVSIT